MIDHICRNVVLSASAVLYKELLFGSIIIVHVCQSSYVNNNIYIYKILRTKTLLLPLLTYIYYIHIIYIYI